MPRGNRKPPTQDEAARIKELLKDATWTGIVDDMEGEQTLVWYWWGQTRSTTCPVIEGEQARPAFVLVKEGDNPRVIPLGLIDKTLKRFDEGLGCPEIARVYGTDLGSQDCGEWLKDSIWSNSGLRRLFEAIEGRNKRKRRRGDSAPSFPGTQSTKAASTKKVPNRRLTDVVHESCKLSDEEIKGYRGYLDKQNFPIDIEGRSCSLHWEIIWKTPYFDGSLWPYLMPRDRSQAEAILGRFKPQGINMCILVQLYHVKQIPAWLEPAVGKALWGHFQHVHHIERCRQSRSKTKFLRIETIEAYASDITDAISSVATETSADDLTISATPTDTASQTDSNMTPNASTLASTEFAPTTSAASASGSVTDTGSLQTSTNGSAPTSLETARDESQTPPAPKRPTGGWNAINLQ